ncbi:hypothetical protein [Pedobacter sp. MR2016-24]|uniref:hypothetical protein n=1 Tax=Pedobacter sp. MR2016-24 TaxID=2994466 RepID=UPI002245BDD0|nr:hypothetical protein [Pedobacter sp. MR2016-24]MCX2482832.1 hypothetical protein [Pedobacter sp. MR2016-24]
MFDPIDITDYQFKHGNNIDDLDLLVNLKSLRSHHTIAAFEANTLEELAEDITRMKFTFPLNYRSETDWQNINHQMRLIKKQLQDTTHLNNLLYLGTQLIKTDKEILIEQHRKSSIFPDELENILIMSGFADSATLSTLELTLIDKGPKQPVKVAAGRRLSKAFLFAMLKPYISYLCEDYDELISHILNREVTEETITLNDLSETRERLKRLILNNPDSSFEEHFLNKALKYLRDNKVFQYHKSANTLKDYPTSEEARVIYLVYNLCTNQPFVKSGMMGGIEVKEFGRNYTNYNSAMINHLIKKYKDLSTTAKKRLGLYKTAIISNQTFELYLPKIVENGSK